MTRYLPFGFRLELEDVKLIKVRHKYSRELVAYGTRSNVSDNFVHLVLYICPSNSVLLPCEAVLSEALSKASQSRVLSTLPQSRCILCYLFSMYSMVNFVIVL